MQWIHCKSRGAKRFVGASGFGIFPLEESTAGSPGCSKGPLEKEKHLNQIKASFLGNLC